MHFPNSSELLPSAEVLCKDHERVLHVLLDRLNEVDDLRVGSDVVEEVEYQRFILARDLLRRGFNARPIHPTDKQFGAK